MSSRNIPSADVKPAPQADIIIVHTLSMYVANKPGVLGRICAVFSRRGFNIDSLVVSQGRDPRYSAHDRRHQRPSRGPAPDHSAVQQAHRRHPLLRTHRQGRRGEGNGPRQAPRSLDHRTEILQIIEHFNGKTVDLQADSLIVMITGNSDKVDAAVRLLAKFEIIETVRTGKVVMARGIAET